MSLTLSEVEHMTKAQRDAQLLSLFVTLNGGTMTDEEKRFFEAKSPAQRDVAILDAIITLNGGTLTSSDKRFIERKSEGQRDALIWEAASEITTGGSTNTGNAVVGDVLSGKTFSSALLTNQAGTMTNRGAVSITPSTISQSIAAGYHNGGGSVAGDADLVVGNIKDGVTIFGVLGTLVPYVPIEAANPTALQTAMLDLAAGSIGKALNEYSFDPENPFGALTTGLYILGEGEIFQIDPHPGDNGTVESSNIVPASAWIKFMEQAYDQGGPIGRAINLSDLAVSHIDIALLTLWAETCAAAGGDPISLNLAGGSCSTSDVDDVLAVMDDSRFDSVNVNVSGGTMGIPTGGDANAHVVAIRGRGSIATINT